MTSQTLFALRMLGCELGEQHGEFVPALALQPFDAAGSRCLRDLLSHAAFGSVTYASIEQPEELLALQTRDPTQRCFAAADRRQVAGASGRTNARIFIRRPRT